MIALFEQIGRYFQLLGKVFSRPEKFRIYRRRIWFEIGALGFNSISLTAIISAFIGAVVALQMAITLESPFIPQFMIGYAPREVIDAVLPYLDVVLMDIKHINGEKHQAYTTRDNALILENARVIAKEANRLIIRTPVIPTFNDTPEEIAAIAEFAASLGSVKEMHLLPYHRIGSDKYAGLGRNYEMSHISPPDKQTMQKLVNVVEEHGLKCQIGG